MPNDSGLRRVIANGKAGAELWPHDQRRVTNAGLVYRNTDANVTVVEGIPDTKQAWDSRPSGYDTVPTPDKGPAVRELEHKRGENG